MTKNKVYLIPMAPTISIEVYLTPMFHYENEII